ncbi:MAG: hypothetical protein ACKV1O_22770, partial [Saprospiraceae bacterium]
TILYCESRYLPNFFKNSVDYLRIIWLQEAFSKQEMFMQQSRFTAKKEQEKGIATMRTVETLNNLLGANSITIAYADGVVERIDLKRTKISDQTQNIALINENLNKITSKGYRLISTNDSTVEGIFMTTYLFEKE